MAAHEQLSLEDYVMVMLYFMQRPSKRRAKKAIEVYAIMDGLDKEFEVCTGIDDLFNSAWATLRWHGCIKNGRLTNNCYGDLHRAIQLLENDETDPLRTIRLVASMSEDQLDTIILQHCAKRYKQLHSNRQLHAKQGDRY